MQAVKSGLQLGGTQAGEAVKPVGQLIIRKLCGSCRQKGNQTALGGRRFCLPTKERERKLVEETTDFQTREIKNQQDASADPAFPGLYHPGGKDETTGEQNPGVITCLLLQKIKMNSV